MHIFLSDAHIRNDEDKRAKFLIKFLNEYEEKIENLYILGDLFEFWFEYDVVIPKGYFKTLATLYNLIKKGKGVTYIMGNHEVLIGKFLKTFGFIVYEDEAVINLGRKKLLLAHGHRIDKRNWTRIWEVLLTSKFNHQLYRLIHPDIGVCLAQGIAFFSRKQRRSSKLVHMLETFAIKKLHDFDIVILAHSHIPMIKKYDKNKYYINTGDWVDNFSYVIMEEDKISLNYYNQSKKNQVLTLE